jgi:opacity protein-like surface antigen
MKKIIYIAGALMLLFPALAGAQALPFTAADYDAASLGKAGTNLTETGSIADASFSNAAAIPFSDSKFDVSAGYVIWQPSAVKSNIVNVGAAYNANNKFGIALGFMYGMNQPYDITNESGAVKGQYTPTDMRINAGLSWRFIPVLSLGVNVEYASNTLAEDHLDGAFNADVFLMTKISGIKATLGVANLGTGITSGTGVKFSLPASAVLGVGYETTFAQKHGVDVSLDADYFFKGGFAASVGAEYTFNDLVSARAGYRYGGNTVIPSYASVGVGAKFAGVKLDVAYLIASGAMKNTLALSLGYSF